MIIFLFNIYLLQYCRYFVKSFEILSGTIETETLFGVAVKMLLIMVTLQEFGLMTYFLLPGYSSAEVSRKGQR